MNQLHAMLCSYSTLFDFGDFSLFGRKWWWIALHVQNIVPGSNWPRDSNLVRQLIALEKIVRAGTILGQFLGKLHHFRVQNLLNEVRYGGVTERPEIREDTRGLGQREKEAREEVRVVGGGSKL
jgi:hypothetical protein